VLEHDGQQYVAVLSGGNSLIGSARGDSVWLFGLEGTLDEAEPGDTPLVPQIVMGVETGSAQLSEPVLARGSEIYRQTCVVCHGDDGRGGHGGGSPLNELSNINTVMTVVRDGRNQMPPLGLALTAQQILDVSSYVMDEFRE
jgi:cytochrome c5